MWNNSLDDHNKRFLIDNLFYEIVLSFINLTKDISL